MKYLILKIIIILNLWRLALIPTFKFCFDRKFRNLIKADFNRLDESPYKSDLFNFYYHIMYNKTFRAIVSFRIRKKSVIFSRIFNIFFPPKVDLELDGNIEGGIRINHGQSSVIVLSKAGKNLTVYQNVTCGRNKKHLNNKDNTNLNCYPSVGENVTIYSGAVVVGGIEIGDNVEIGANSVITKDIPSNSTVVGNPPLIVKKNGKKVKIVL